MIKSHYTDVDGYTLHSLEAGAGPPVLLLHGFACAAEDWRPTLEVLAQHGYHAIAVDALGFGRSAKPVDAPYSLDLYARLYNGFLAARGLQRVALVAHSMGGKLALATAVLFPERVSRLFLAAANGFNEPTATSSKGRLNLLPDGLALRLVAQPAAVRFFLSTAFYQPATYVTRDLVTRGTSALSGRDNRQALLALSRRAAANDLSSSGLRARLGELHCPTVLVWGTADRVVGLDQGQRARHEIPGAQLVTIPQCGHFPQVEAFRAFHGLLLGFLAADGIKPAV